MLSFFIVIIEKTFPIVNINTIYMKIKPVQQTKVHLCISLVPFFISSTRGIFKVFI